MVFGLSYRFFFKYSQDVWFSDCYIKWFQTYHNKWFRG